MNKRYWTVLAVVVAAAVGIGIVVGTKNRQASGDHPRNVLQPTAIQHNSQDVEFCQTMIQHHARSIQMATLADERADNAQVKRMAAAIKTTKAAEVETMKQWLADWGQPESVLPQTTNDEMANLSKSSGAEFDQQFLSMMIPHHEAAIAAATTQQAKGRYAPAKELANTIVAGQRSEISILRQLLTNT